MGVVYCIPKVPEAERYVMTNIDFVGGGARGRIVLVLPPLSSHVCVQQKCRADSFPPMTLYFLSPIQGPSKDFCQSDHLAVSTKYQMFQSLIIPRGSLPNPYPILFHCHH